MSYFKNSIWVFCLVPYLLSCSTDDSPIQLNEFQNARITRSFWPDSMCVEEYVPKGECKEIVLSNGLKVYLDEDSVFFLEDMVFSKEQIEKMDSCPTRSAVIKSYVNYWPQINTIPYVISNNTVGGYGFSSSDKNRIRAAVSMISAEIPLTFVEVSSTSSQHYIEFMPSVQGCYTTIGMQSGKSVVNLASWFSVGNATHELMHVLGFFHEQTREDRDDYIVINYENIEEGKQSNFQKYSINYTGCDIGTFDFNSIMLYGSYAFSRNGVDKTMEKLDGSSFVGQRDSLSSGDIKGLHYIYGSQDIHIRYQIDTLSYNEIDEYGYWVLDASYRYDAVFIDNNGNVCQLPEDRQLVVVRRETGWGEYVTDYYQTYYSYINVAEGTSSVTLGYGEQHIHEEYGNCWHNTLEDYYIRY